MKSPLFSLRLLPGESRGQNQQGGRGALAVRTQKEVAAILGVTFQCVQRTERRALAKLRLRLGSIEKNL